MTDPFYKTKRWERLRAAILQRDGYRCQMAAHAGKSIPADTVHHIFPLKDYPEYRWEPWNLISLSRAAHEKLHYRSDDKLTYKGRLLLEATAEEQGIELKKKRTILVIGNPGTGKTAYVRNNLGRGVVFDLDYLAAALRLSKPKTDDLKAARWIANSLIGGFPEAAHKYVDDVFVIRTAPGIDELEEIRPTELVVIRGGYGNENIPEERRKKIARRINAAVEWARTTGVKVKEIDG